MSAGAGDPAAKKAEVTDESPGAEAAAPAAAAAAPAEKRPAQGCAAFRFTFASGSVREEPSSTRCRNRDATDQLELGGRTAPASAAVETATSSW